MVQEAVLCMSAPRNPVTSQPKINQFLSDVCAGIEQCQGCCWPSASMQILRALTPLPGNKIFEIFSHMCNICNTYPEKAVTAFGRVISGYTAT